MKIKIICLGKTKDKFLQNGIDEYLKRIRPFAETKFEVLPDCKLTKSNTIEIVKQQEAKTILQKLPKNSFNIALDENGKSVSSVEFAQLLGNKAKVNFIIGGVYGLDKSVLSSCNQTISLSKLTFTHRMVRLLLSEQIYRGFTILNNKSYHY